MNECAAMDRPWYRKLFGHARGPDANSTRAKAEQGDAEAQFALGLECGYGEGPAQDFVQAAQWYRKAADQNHALAQYNLAVMYARGQGVPRNDAEAVGWIRKAAALGDAGAQYKLGMDCHRDSVGGPRVKASEARIEAYKWLCLAAGQGYRDSVAACELVNQSMTREEVVQGNRRAASFATGASAPPSGQSSR